MYKIITENNIIFDCELIYNENITIQGKQRLACNLTLINTDYDTIINNFSDTSKWKIENNSDWSVYEELNSIIDSRDGKFKIQMLNKLSKEEILEDEKEKLKANINLIMGETNNKISPADFRKELEELYTFAELSDTKRISYRALCPLWEKGNHKAGEIYQTIYGKNTTDKTKEQIWECFCSYDNEVYNDLTPEDGSWLSFNRPLHGTSPETAMPWVRPTNATDIYRKDEYMIFTDNLMYVCLQNTSFSPTEQLTAWKLVN